MGAGLDIVNDGQHNTPVYTNYAVVMEYMYINMTKVYGRYRMTMTNIE